MKILICPSCNDAVALTEKAKLCSCQQVGGAHINDEQVVYHGNPILIEVEKAEILLAQKGTSLFNSKIKFDTFAVPVEDKNFIKVGKREI